MVLNYVNHTAAATYHRKCFLVLISDYNKCPPSSYWLEWLVNSICIGVLGPATPSEARYTGYVSQLGLLNGSFSRLLRMCAKFTQISALNEWNFAQIWRLARKRVKFCIKTSGLCTYLHTTIRRNTRLEDHVRMSMACASGFSDSSYTVLILNQEPSGRLIDNSM